MATRIKPKRNTAQDAAEFRAVHKFARISPQKSRLVMDQVRDLPVSDALDQLRHMNQRAAAMIDKLLKSAIANADQAIEQELIRNARGDILEPQPEVDVDDLYVHEAVVGDGPRIKRWRPRARGAAYPFRRPFAHLTIRLRPMPGKEG